MDCWPSGAYCSSAAGLASFEVAAWDPCRGMRPRQLRSHPALLPSVQHVEGSLEAWWGVQVGHCEGGL